MSVQTPDEWVAVATTNGVTEITLRRAAKANALSAALVDTLSAALIRVLGDISPAHADGPSPIIVFRSEGKNFCAGFDLSTLEFETDATLIARLEKLETLLQTIYHAPCATIALIQGGAFGAGFDLAMACDYRLAAPEAQFRMPGWRMGLALGTRRTCARVGQEVGFDFLRNASIIDAATAQQQKFVTEIADVVIWPRRVEEIAKSIRTLPTNSYARLKRMVLADTRVADMQDLLESLRETPLKPRMQRYVESRNSSK